MQHHGLPKRVPFNLFLSVSRRQGRYTRDKKIQVGIINKMVITFVINIESV